MSTKVDWFDRVSLLIYFIGIVLFLSDVEVSTHIVVFFLLLGIGLLLVGAILRKKTIFAVVGVITALVAVLVYFYSNYKDLSIFLFIVGLSLFIINDILIRKRKKSSK